MLETQEITRRKRGRPRVNESERRGPSTFSIATNKQELLDQAAEQLGVSRSDLMNAILETVTKNYTDIEGARAILDEWRKP